MKANDVNVNVICAAVCLTMALRRDARDVAEYIDCVPEFLLSVYDATDGPDDDLLDEFLAWITQRND